jgi:glycosyltransferase involved in cell wall biosynthesis
MIGVLMMVKNESLSIKVSLESTKGYFSDIIIFDTGSEDNTIEIIEETCKKNQQNLYVKKGIFKSFPESRNEAIEFAESVIQKEKEKEKKDNNVLKYILMMDAGDEFRTDKNPGQFMEVFRVIKPGRKNDFDIGIIQQKWLEKKEGGRATISDHYDCRLIKVDCHIRYDITYPVHEQVCNANTLFSCNFGDLFHLYQDREKYGGSSEKRYARDIEMLLQSNLDTRNLYFLAQSYMSMNDFKNGFKYNVLCYEKNQKMEKKTFDDTFTLVRIAFCAIQIKLIDVALKYLEISLMRKEEDVPIDIYIYYFDIYIKRRDCVKLIPMVEKLYKMKKPTVSSSIKLINHYFYDYLRYNLISVVCLMSQQKIEVGKKSLEKILHYGKAEDYHNYEIYKNL